MPMVKPMLRWKMPSPQKNKRKHVLRKKKQPLMQIFERFSEKSNYAFLNVEKKALLNADYLYL
jgi:hypothetical protein